MAKAANAKKRKREVSAPADGIATRLRGRLVRPQLEEDATPQTPKDPAATASNNVSRPRLIQERYAHNLYHLVIQAILWNQTAGRQARPVLEALIEQYPTPETLARADEAELRELLRPIGLHNQRAKRLVKLGRAWIESPPRPGKVYVRKGYPVAAPPAAGAGQVATTVPLKMGPAAVETNAKPARQKAAPAKSPSDIENSQAAAVIAAVTAPPAVPVPTSKAQEGWEIAHLPGVGPYALDSFRIFHRDEMRGLAADWLGGDAGRSARKGGKSGVPFEPEWKRVTPADKDLKAYVKWLWALE